MSGWFQVPEFVGTRHRARELRAEAEATGCDVLNFADTKLITLPAADELVCNGHWMATTGENADVRETVEWALQRRGRIPSPTLPSQPESSDEGQR